MLFACTQRNISYCSAPPSGWMEQVEHGTFRSRPPAGAGVGSAAVSEGGGSLSMQSVFLNIT